MEKTGYIVVIPLDVEDQITKLPKEIQGQIKRIIENKLKVDPISFGKPLQHCWAGHRRLRLGKYRIIYKIEHQLIKVILVKIGLRKNVYEE